MENEVLGYKSPLFGRRTAQIILGECKWREAVGFRAETEKLISKKHLLPEYTERYYYLFAKSSTAKGQEYNDATTVTADMLFEV